MKLLAKKERMGIVANSAEKEREESDEVEAVIACWGMGRGET